MLGDRIKEARKARDMSRQALAAATRIPYSTLADLENDRQKSSTELHRIASALRVRIEWLADGIGQRDLRAPELDDDWTDVLGYRQAAALGDGAIPDEYAETHKLRFRAESLRRKRLRPDALGICYGRGDSMLPRIKSGDAILFDRNNTEPADGALFVVSYDGSLLAKRLVQLGGRWFMESLNRDDPKWRKPVPIDEQKSFTIHGRVRWIGSWED